MGGWFMAWMTGKGSSVGPGIIRISREAWGADHLMASVLVELMKGLLGALGARLGEAALLAPDKVEIAQINDEPGALTQDEHRVLAINGVDEQGRPAADREEPERDR